jgi:uncharacterized protein
MMTTEAFIAVNLDDPLRFDCHPGVSCFNNCCRDLNQALTPYDVLRLRRHLGVTSREFLRSYTLEHTGPATGLPIISLHFDQVRQGLCPFVTSAGCRVYAARPASCRLYPLARAVRRSRADGRTSIHYALFREAHCQGFEQSRTQTVRTWVSAQDLKIDFKMNDALMELIALKNRFHPGPLAIEQQQLLKLALYDPDAFRMNVDTGAMTEWEGDAISAEDDIRLLEWSMAWVMRKLFGHKH